MRGGGGGRRGVAVGAGAARGRRRGGRRRARRGAGVGARFAARVRGAPARRRAGRRGALRRRLPARGGAAGGAARRGWSPGERVGRGVAAASAAWPRRRDAGVAHARLGMRRASRRERTPRAADRGCQSAAPRSGALLAIPRAARGPQSSPGMSPPSGAQACVATRDRLGVVVHQQVAAAEAAATAPSVPEPANGSRHRSPGRLEAWTMRRTIPSGFCVG